MPGQHVFLSCHSVVPLQSHPFTIASLPSDGKMEFLVRSARGGTRRMHRYAEKNHGGLPTHKRQEITLTSRAKSVAIEGPYGRMRPLPQFDSVVFLAGGSGATFTVPLLRDLIQRWHQSGTAIVTRRIRFVWVVKGRGQISWFAAQLNQALEDVALLAKEATTDVEIKMSVYVTCDDSLTDTPHDRPLPSSSRSSLHDYSITEQLLSSAGTESPASEETKTHPTVSAEALVPLADRNDEAIDAANPAAQSCCKPAPSTTAPTAGRRSCCCTAIVTDEKSAAANTCNCSSPSDAASSSSQSSAPLLHPSVTLVGGRPSPRDLILPTLEQALGETAVVCCGPQGLESDVRTAVVDLCDERAVCKGSGALAVWYWGEGFGY
jgi:hypothetical protein